MARELNASKLGTVSPGVEGFTAAFLDDEAFARAARETLMQVRVMELNGLLRAIVLFGAALLEVQRYTDDPATMNGNPMRAAWARLAEHQHWPGDPRQIPRKDG